MAESTTNKKPRFLPDPTKWIQTAPSSSNSSTKKHPQRPLTALKNGLGFGSGPVPGLGLSTPPTSVKRSFPLPSHAAGTSASRQESLTGFFTPPPSVSALKAGRGSPSRGLGQKERERKSRLRVRADSEDQDQDLDYGHGDVVGRKALQIKNASTTSHAHATSRSGMGTKRPRVAPLQSHRSAPVTSSSSSGMSDGIEFPPLPFSTSAETETPLRQKKKLRRTLTSSPSPPLFLEDRAEDSSPGVGHDSPHPSSDRPNTPVPDYILDIHRRLCGRDEERMSKVRSPWRSATAARDEVQNNKSDDNHTPIKRQGQVSRLLLAKQTRREEHARHAVDSRAHDQALVRRRNRNKENTGKKLVLDSSQAEREGGIKSPDNKEKRQEMPTPIRMPPLAPLVVNTMRHNQPLSMPKFDNGLVVSSKRKRHSRSPSKANEIDVSPSAVYRELCDPAPSPKTKDKAPDRSPTTHVTTPNNNSSNSKLRRFPTGLSPRSAIPLTSPSPSPKREPVSPLSQATRAGPSRTVDKTPHLPSDPRTEVREFVPVPMQAETLVTWSLGPRPGPPVERQDTRPQPHPIQASTPGKQGNEMGESTETQSLAPSAASQSFPNLAPSPTRARPSSTHAPRRSPPSTSSRNKTVMPEIVRRSTASIKLSEAGSTRSTARFQTDLGVGESVIPVQDHNTPKAGAAGKRNRSPWPAFGFGDLDTTPSGATVRPDIDTPSASGSKRSKSKGSLWTASQSKLAAFGFFGDKRMKSVRGFDQEWEQEDDLPFEQEQEGESAQEMDAKDSKAGRNRHLQKVPPPPPHPELRPAGLRELKKRQARDRDRDREPNDEHDHEQPLFPDIDDGRGDFNNAFFPSSSPGASASTDDQHQSSSFTTSTEGELGRGMSMDMNSSAVAWWDGLEDRRSSEFGSLS